MSMGCGPEDRGGGGEGIAASGRQAKEQQLLPYDREGPVVSYRWTGWVREKNRLEFKVAGKSPIILEEFIEEYTPIHKGESEDVNM